MLFGVIVVATAGIYITGFLWFMDEYAGKRNSFLWAFLWPLALYLDKQDQSSR
jgi:hypothetical protein